MLKKIPNIKILGGPKCRKTELALERVKEAVKEMGIEARIERLTRAADITEYPVKYMPGIVVDEKVVYSSRGSITDKRGVRLTVPDKGEIISILGRFINREH